MPRLTTSASVGLQVSDSMIVIAPASPPAGTVTDAYHFGFSASGGSPPYEWTSSGALPPGLTLGSDGTVSGTPSQAGSFTFSVTATDSAQAPKNSAPLATRISIDNTPSGFTATGTMLTTREVHTVTLLNNSKVLVAGGMHWAPPPNCVFRCGLMLSALASAELYDEGTAQFTSTGGMSVARVNHTATLLNNGNVLVAGGDDRYSATYATAELYDPSTGQFSATGSMLVARSAHAVALLVSGKVLIAGGAGTMGSLSSAELYDPTTGQFSFTGNMTTSRFGHTATLLEDGSGRVLVTGGETGNGPGTSTELYDPATGTFSPTGSMAVPRYAHRATLLANGMVLVTGGAGTVATAELFDPVRGTFTTTGSMETPRTTHTATRLSDGTVLVAGGDAPTPTSSAELYDPGSGRFTPAGDMTMRRSEHEAVLLRSGTALISGGINTQNPWGLNSLATAELFP
jgi:hypothetical protein